MTVAQPAAGTALHADWTTNLIWARNEAETTATTLAAGSGWTRTTAGSGVSFSTDADGRYLTGAAASSFEAWSGNAIGPEYTIFAIVKRVASGSSQAIIDGDDNGNSIRRWQFNINSSGTVNFIVFDSSNSVVANFNSTATVSTSDDVGIIARVRNDAGTYKALIQIGPTATAETNCSATPATLSSAQRFGLGEGLNGGKLSTSKLYFGAIFNRALSGAELTLLGANPWAIYDAQSGGGGSSKSGLNFMRQSFNRTF